MSAPVFTIAPARSAGEVAAIATLFHEYAVSLGIDLSFQHFGEEVAHLPGDYAEPGGVLLLARVGAQDAGCVGLRPLEAGVCEMKRLYVRPDHRRLKIGEALATAVIAAARDRSYERMRLDTLPSMRSAQALYERLGFKPIAPYRFNPVEGTTYLELAI